MDKFHIALPFLPQEHCSGFEQSGHGQKAECAGTGMRLCGCVWRVKAGKKFREKE